MSARRYTLKKAEKITSKRTIEHLVNKKLNQSISLYPFILAWVYEPFDPEKPVPVKVLFSVPVKKFKKAVDRNRIKRKLRELFRLNKHSFYNIIDDSKGALAMMLLYIGKEDHPYSFLNEKFLLLIEKFRENNT